jgi:hypothetical protein
LDCNIERQLVGVDNLPVAGEWGDERMSVLRPSPQQGLVGGDAGAGFGVSEHQGRPVDALMQ